MINEICWIIVVIAICKKDVRSFYITAGRKIITLFIFRNQNSTKLTYVRGYKLN